MTLRIGDWCSGGTGGEGYLLLPVTRFAFRRFLFLRRREFSLFLVRVYCALRPMRGSIKNRAWLCSFSVFGVLL